MTSWLSAFVARFTRQAGRPPNPLELAHNMPKDMSDGEAMLSMVKWMEDGAVSFTPALCTPTENKGAPAQEKTP